MYKRNERFIILVNKTPKKNTRRHNDRIDKPSHEVYNSLKQPEIFIRKGSGNMKKILTGITAVVISAAMLPVCASAEDSEAMTMNGRTYCLTFYDDFDGDTLNENNWHTCREEERQDLGGWWDNRCVSLDGNGHLLLTAAWDSENQRLISGAIDSEGLFEQKYGYYEVRCQLQPMDNFWSAFWLNCGGTSLENGSGTDGTEIDIFESAYRRESMVGSALHYDGYGDAHRSKAKNYRKNGLYTGYHTFALEWTEEGYTFYTDGVKTWQTDFGGVSQVPEYMLLSTEFGSWTGQPDIDKLPAAFSVDYVKVYKCADDDDFGTDYTSDDSGNMICSPSHWYRYGYGGADGTLNIISPNEVSAQAKILNGGGYQTGYNHFVLKSGKTYRLEFTACRKKGVGSIYAAVNNDNDYREYLSEKITVNSKPKKYSFTFTAEDTYRGGLYFSFGSSGTYRISDISLCEI